MGDVVALNSRRGSGTFNYAQKGKLILREAAFFAAVFSPVVSLQIIYCAYGGLTTFIALACSGLAGVALGVALYRRAPDPIMLGVSTGTVRQAPPSEGATLKDAA